MRAKVEMNMAMGEAYRYATQHGPFHPLLALGREKGSGSTATAARVEGYEFSVSRTIRRGAAHGPHRGDSRDMIFKTFLDLT